MESSNLYFHFIILLTFFLLIYFCLIKNKRVSRYPISITRQAVACSEIRIPLVDTSYKGEKRVFDGGDKCHPPTGCHFSGQTIALPHIYTRTQRYRQPLQPPQLALRWDRWSNSGRFDSHHPAFSSKRIRLETRFWPSWVTDRHLSVTELHRENRTRTCLLC